MEESRGCNWANWPDANYWRRANPTLPTATSGWLASGSWAGAAAAREEDGWPKQNTVAAPLTSVHIASHHRLACPIAPASPFLLGLARLCQCPSWMRPIRLSALLADAMAGSWSHLTSQQRRASVSTIVIGGGNGCATEETSRCE